MTSFDRLVMKKLDTFGIDLKEPDRGNYHLVVQLCQRVAIVPAREKILSFDTKADRDAIWAHLVEILFGGKPKGAVVTGDTSHESHEIDSNADLEGP